MSTDPTRRLAALDWMRGIVMVLMAIDHASQTWNGGRVNADSAYLLDPSTGGPLWIAGSEIDGLQFATRWITHLCAPTFLFLSGTSLAMSLAKRRGEGASEGSLDRHLAIRAGVIFAFEGLLSLLAAQGVLILQVLFAIGASMLAMIVLRRLPAWAIAGAAVLWLGLGETLLTSAMPIGEVDRPLWQLLLFVPAYAKPVTVLYPLTHWLAMMMLGWVFGRFLLERPAGTAGLVEAEKLMLISGPVAIVASLVLRRLNAYGNMGLLRDDASWIQWLHMSKYPPALTFTGLELGLMAIGLLIAFRIERRLSSPPSPWNPLLVFGQTALFFYVLHFVLLGGTAFAITGDLMQRGLLEAWIAAATVLVVLYPVCVAFRALKRRHPRSPLQYV